MGNDEEKALAIADELLAEFGFKAASEAFRHLLAVAYLKGTHAGLIEVAAKNDAALTRLAEDLAAVKP